MAGVSMRADEPAWRPTPEVVAGSNLAWLMKEVGVDSYDALHRWSATNRAEYWRLAIERLGIRFREPYRDVLDLSGGVESPKWLPGARFNLVESCFAAASESAAIVHQAEGGPLRTMTVSELAKLTDRVAASLASRGFAPGSAIAIVMPMTAESVAIYLGILKAGCVAVGIADSFRPPEIAARLRLSNAVAVFTQDVVVRGGKTHPLYANVVEAGAPFTVVLPVGEHLSVAPRCGHRDWSAFLDGAGLAETVMR